MDCLGTCDGSAVEDECGDCGGNGPKKYFNCDGILADGCPSSAVMNLNFWVEDNSSALSINGDINSLRIYIELHDMC